MKLSFHYADWGICCQLEGVFLYDSFSFVICFYTLAYYRYVYNTFALFHTDGVKRTKTGKNSRRPAIIQNDMTIFENAE